MRDVVIVEAVRAPQGRRGGVLSEIRADDLLAAGLAEGVRRAGVGPSRGGGAPPPVNRQGGSSHQAIHFAAQAIASGDMDVAIACGVESMSRVPLGSDYGEWNPRLMDRYHLVHQGIAAEMLGKRQGAQRG